MASQRGVSLVVEKLENSIKNGEFYEAHQMYRTIYFRYLAQRKYKELKDMLFQGSLMLLNANQKTSGADLGTLLVDVLTQSEDKDCESWSPKLSQIFLLIGSEHATERNAFLARCVKWSMQGGTQGNPTLHQGLAKVYWDEKNYSHARSHFIHSEDGKGCAKLLIEFQILKGYKNEVDLFIAQAVLQFLCLRNKVTANQTFSTYTEEHPRIRKSGPPYILPLLNFIWFLLQAIESKKIQAFAVLCEKYQPSIKRDPCYVQYLDRIGQIFFGIKPPEQKKLGGLFGNIFDSFMGGLEEFQDSDEEASQSSSSRPSTSQLQMGDVD